MQEYICQYCGKLSRTYVTHKRHQETHTRCRCRFFECSPLKWLMNTSIYFVNSEWIMAILSGHQLVLCSIWIISRNSILHHLYDLRACLNSFSYCMIFLVVETNFSIWLSPVQGWTKSKIIIDMISYWSYYCL